MGNYRSFNRTLVTWFSIEDWRRTYSRTVNYSRDYICRSINQRKTIPVRKGGVAKLATPFYILICTLVIS